MTEVTAEAQIAQIWDHLRGYHAVYHMSVGIECGLFAALGETGEAGMDPAALAESAGLHPPYVRVWCETGYHYGFLEGDEDGEARRYRLAPYMDAILVNEGDPRLLAPYVSTVVNFGASELKDLPRFFRTGEVERFQDKGHDFSRHVGDTTAGLHILVARKILPSLPGMKDKLEAGARVLDVGCGLGGLMCKVADAWPNVECVGLDIDPHGIEQAEARIADAGLADRVSVRLASGEAAADEEFDLALMFEVLHEIDAGVRAGVVEGAARSLKPGGVLWILDETYPSSLAELRDPSFNFAVQTQLNELVWGNVVPTEAEQQSLLSGAGLSLVHREMIGGIFTMLVAVKD